MSLTVTFHGAAGAVTGSCYLVQQDGARILVDCGLFQEGNSFRALNHAPLPYAAKSLSAIVLTHAHLDHSGLVPRLIKEGYGGPVYATPGTADLLSFLWPDSGNIQESEVRHRNQQNRQRGDPPVRGIYGRAGAVKALERLRTVPHGEWFEPAAGIRCRYWDAGHILGSASLEIDTEGTDGAQKLLFSGDLGPDARAFHDGPRAPSGIDYLFMESTYGDRKREAVDEAERHALLAREVRAALDRGGNLLMPVFAVERTQELLYDLDILFDRKLLPPVKIFLDSPLALQVTEIFDRHLPDVNEPGTPHPFHRPNLFQVESARKSKQLSRSPQGAIIMAGSGMCEAGRIREHLKSDLPRSEATILLVGYQAPGTLGRQLHDGAKKVSLQGEEIAVKAQVRSLDVYSGHADQQGLLHWAQERLPLRHSLFLTHGKDLARTKLRLALPEIGIKRQQIRLPELDQCWRLTQRGARLVKGVPVRLHKGAGSTHEWHNDAARIGELQGVRGRNAGGRAAARAGAGRKQTSQTRAWRR